MKADFSGYASRANVQCSDGRTILPNAFQDADGTTVPLVWQHGHSNIDNVLGHARLENRSDGLYAYGFFNDSNSGRNAKNAVEHGDVKSLSIYANQLQQDGGHVKHGVVREVSLVLAGANPEARIDNVYLKHEDGSREELEDAARIFSGELIHSDESESKSDDKSNDSDSDDRTVEDVLNSMTEEQRTVVDYLVGQAIGEEDDDSDDKEADTNKGDMAQSDQSEGDQVMHKNVFENNNETSVRAGDNALTHSDVKEILNDAKNRTHSLQQSILAHAESKGYGVDNIEFLFPEAKALDNTPEFISRQMEWVSSVLNGARKIPFSRIKTLYADLTADEARAKGYITGNMKKEEFFGLAKRETSPTTIYKKQKLDRDDIIDVTTMDIVSWLWGEMRLMLNEEIARAILIGDGRDVEDPDKIDETKIRPILKDNEFFTHQAVVPASSDNSSWSARAHNIIDAIVRAKRYYKGSGNLTFYTSADYLADFLLLKDQDGRRIYNDKASVMAAMGVSNIHTVEFLDLEEPYNNDGAPSSLVGILVDMRDYTIGTDRGGEITRFDDFDIDFNQYKYLLEGRMSGSLTKHKSAISVWINKSEGVEGEAPQPEDYSQQFDPRSNHPRFRSEENYKKFEAEKKKKGSTGEQGLGDVEES